MVPLPPDKIQQIWNAIKPFDFTATHGLMMGFDISAHDVKGRVLESMKIQTKMQGFSEASIFQESWP